MPITNTTPEVRQELIHNIVDAMLNRQGKYGNPYYWRVSSLNSMWKIFERIRGNKDRWESGHRCLLARFLKEYDPDIYNQLLPYITPNPEDNEDA
jgi:hypothetical protein